MRKLRYLRPDFSYEKKCWNKGCSFVIGVDEVGRGALAGPVVAGAVVIRIKKQESRIKENKYKIPNSSFLIPNSILNLGIDDSKRLSPEKRELLAREIKKLFYCGIGEGSVSEINLLGIVRATERAMRRAIKNIKYQISNIKNTNKISNIFIISDAFHIKYLKGIGLKNQQAIIKGDQKSISIAAASIIAKVYRDNLMKKLAIDYQQYSWEKNKGYGTEFHCRAILKNGVTNLHRKKFVRFALNPTKIP